MLVGVQMFAKGMERVMPTANKVDRVQLVVLWAIFMDDPANSCFLFKNQQLIMSEFIT